MKPKPPVKLPKARVMYVHSVDSLAPRYSEAMLYARSTNGRLKQTVAVIPCRSRREAREILRLHRMSDKEIRHLVWKLTPTYADVAKGVYSRIDLMKAIIQALHLIP